MQGSHSSPIISKPMFIHSPAMATLERPKLQVLFLSTTSYSLDYPFGQFMLAVPTMSPASLSLTPRLLAEGADSEKQRKP